MNITSILIEMFIFAALFTAMVFWKYGTDKKYSAAGIHNYPPDIQEEYFKTHPKVDVTYHNKNVVLMKSFGIFVFTAVLFVCAKWANATTFLQGFEIGFGLMVWIGAYDTFFLDWVLFANMKMFRLEGTEHMDKEYHQKWFHVKGLLFPGLIFALIPAAITGLAVVIF